MVRDSGQFKQFALAALVVASLAPTVAMANMLTLASTSPGLDPAIMWLFRWLFV